MSGSIRTRLLVLLAIGLPVPAGSAQEDVLLRLDVGDDPVLVGIPFRVGVPLGEEIGGRSDAVLERPTVRMELGPFVVVGHEPDAAGRPGLRLLATRSGDLELPPFGLRWRLADQSARSARTAPLRIPVRSALSPGEPPVLQDELPLERFPRSGVGRLITAGALLLVVAVCAWLLRRRRAARSSSRQRVVAPRGRVRDPRTEALDALRRLASRSAGDAESARSLLAEVADVLRTYLERTTGEPLRVRTTEEVEPVLRRFDADTTAGLPRALLERADLAKYAGRAPESGELTLYLDRTVTFVEQRRTPGANTTRGNA